MSLEDTISTDIKAAMKAKDRLMLDTLRSIKKELIEARTAKGADGKISEDVELKILQKMLKQRQEAAEIFTSEGRHELADVESLQGEIIISYLPAQLSEEEITKVIENIISQVGASSMADMGKVMGLVTKELAGKADGKTISGIVRSKLA